MIGEKRWEVDSTEKKDEYSEETKGICEEGKAQYTQHKLQLFI